jgi:Restriction endonuclease
VPRRTNLFQEVVAIIHRHMAEDATVEESAMLEDRVTGEQREVDVVIRGRAAGHDVAVVVEAAGRGRPATVEWVEQMIGKHANLPTDKLVLVSQSGFTAQARTRAETAGAVVLAPSDLEEGDPALVVVNRLRSLWPKLVSLTPERIGLSVGRIGDEEPYEAPPSAASIPVLLDDGREVGTLEDVVQAQIGANWDKVAEQIGLRDIADDVDAFFHLEIGTPWTVEVEGEERQAFVRARSGPGRDIRPIDKVIVLGKAAIRVNEIPLAHRRLGEIRYAVGEGKVGDQDALVVATEGEGGGKLTVRMRPAMKAE